MKALVALCLVGALFACDWRGSEPRFSSPKGFDFREFRSPYSGDGVSFWKDPRTVVVRHWDQKGRTAELFEWTIGAAEGRKIADVAGGAGTFCYSAGTVRDRKIEIVDGPRTGGYGRMNVFQCRDAPASDLDELAQRRPGYTFTGLLPGHGYLAGPKASIKEYADRANRTPGWVPPKPQPLYLMQVGSKADVELPITACDLPFQFGISYSEARRKYLLRPYLKSDMELLPGCHPYYENKTIQAFWLDPSGALESESIPLPALRTESNFRDFRMFWTKTGWLADDSDRIWLRSGNQWLAVYANRENGRAYYRATSVSPDGCRVGIQVSDFERTSYARVRWFAKQFRVLEMCAP